MIELNLFAFLFALVVFWVWLWAVSTFSIVSGGKKASSLFDSLTLLLALLLLPLVGVFYMLYEIADFWWRILFG